MAGKSVRDECRRMNQACARLYDLYLPLRQRVTALATAAIRPLGAAETVEPTGRLAAPGAGNCNDLDLPILAETFSGVDLIDLDDDAIAHGLQRAFPKGAPAHVRGVGGIDLTGLGKRPRNAPPIPEKSSKFAVKLAKHRPTGLQDGEYDRVVSSSMVGPLITNLALVMGGKHKRFAEAVLAVRDAHVHQLVELLKPGGFGVITVELTSSDSIPELPRWNAKQLLPAFDQIVRQGPTFPGAHPDQLGQALVQTKQVTALNGLSPWRFSFGSRTYLMYGLTFLKKRDGEPVLGEEGTAPDHQIIDSIDYRDSVIGKVTDTDEQGLLVEEGGE